MKLIENINISLSYDKGQKTLLFETLEEVRGFYPDICKEMFFALQIMKKDSNILGFVRAHTFNSNENDFEFVSVYKKEEELGDLKVLFQDARIYNGFVINASSEADFRSKMINIDQGNTVGFFKLNEF